jgi:hypothetical protein
MASSSAASGQSIASGSEQLIFDAPSDGGGCTTFLVRCQSGSAAGVLIRVPELHNTGDQCLVPPGTEEYFRLNHCGIQLVYAEGDGGTASVDWAVVAKTYAV